MTRDKNRLRIVRAEKRLTQLRLALRARIHQSRLSLIENGYAEPSKDERERLSRALQLPEADVFPLDEVQATS